MVETSRCTSIKRRTEAPALANKNGELTPDEKYRLARAARIIAEIISKGDPLTPDQITTLRLLAQAFSSELEAQLPHAVE